MVYSSQKALKTLWEKEKLLVTSNFSFSHCVFKRLVLQTSKNQGLFGKQLKHPLIQYRGEIFLCSIGQNFSTIKKSQVNIIMWCKKFYFYQTICFFCPETTVGNRKEKKKSVTRTISFPTIYVALKLLS